MSNQNALSRLSLVIALVVGVAGLFLALYTAFNRAAPAPTGSAAVIEGQPFDGIERYDPPRPLQDFTLVNQNDQPTTLSSFRGKPTLLFFGFTNCPDVCPMTLLEFKKIKLALGEQAADLNFVFISVDTRRDTPTVIADYLRRFDESFVGLAGDVAVFEQIKGDYELNIIETPKEGSESDYVIDHTPNPFVIDAEGRLVASYLYGTKTEIMLNDLRQRLGS